MPRYSPADAGQAHDQQDARAIERACLKRTSAVLTSSPAFIVYFGPMQQYAGPVMLVENKVLALEAPPLAPSPPAGRLENRRCGVLRCARSLRS